MGDAKYVKIRMDYLCDEITAERARELFEQAQARESAALKGDLDDWFEFYAVEGAEGERLVRCRVQRLGATPEA